MIWVVASLVVFIFQMATILLLEYRKPAKAVAWLSILLVFPIVGFVLYYFLAREYVARRTVRRWGKAAEKLRRAALYRVKPVERLPDTDGRRFAHQERLFRTMQSITDSPLTDCNETQVLSDGEAKFEALFEAIEGAKGHIHAEYYTIRDDRIGERFKEALVRKAKEGVEVRVIYDGIGSIELSRQYVRELKRAGVRAHCFLPPRIAFFDKRMNYRNHRKIVVVDGLIGFVGGFNVGDEYLGGNPKLGFWRDTHLQVRGDAVYLLQEVFLQDWWFAAKELPPYEQYFPEHGCRGNEPVLIVPSGPNAGRDPILESVFAAVSAARSRIYMETPYFIPDPSLSMGLRTAARSGVDVRLILPYAADTKLVMNASLSYVEELLAAGVRVYRYRKGFMHAKVLIVDDLLACVGTANLDMRSFFSNFELNALLFDERAIRRLEADFHRDLQSSEELDLHRFRQRPRRQKAAEALAHLLSPLL